MIKTILSFLRDEKGASAIEYGLIAAGIAIVIGTAVGSAGTKLTALFENIAAKL